MKTLLSTTAAAALAVAFMSSAGSAQSTADDLRPMSMTCQELTEGSSEERSGVVFFIAGYQMAMQQGRAGAGASGETTATTGMATDTDTAASTGTAGETNGTATDTETTASTGTAGETGTATDTDTTASTGTAGETTGTADTGSASTGADSDAAVRVSRSLFAMNIDELVQACEDRPDELAVTVIGEKVREAQ